MIAPCIMLAVAIMRIKWNQRVSIPPYVLSTHSTNEEAFREKSIESEIHQTFRAGKVGDRERRINGLIRQVIAERYAAQYGWIEMVNRPVRQGAHTLLAKVYAFNAGQERVERC